MIEVKCEHCQKVLELTDWQTKFINKSKNKGMTFIMLECNNCTRHTSYDPSSGKLPEIEDYTKYPCPTKKCEGLVVEVEDFWGCGTCGNIWKTEEELKKKTENQKVMTLK